MHSLKPPRLRKGDLIGLVSPASTPSPRAKIERSVQYLEKLGYRVAVGAHASAEHGYLAGTDEQRAEDLNSMIRNPQVKAIFALRGGYGTPRILRQIDYTSLRRAPKIISGFSDITALQLAIYRRTRLVTFSGPMPAVDFWENPDPFTEENFWRLLTSSRKVGPLRNPQDAPLDELNAGASEGVLLGGNLSLVCASLGTPFLPSLTGTILVLEDVDEVPYRLDRMLTQLLNSGVARKIKGLLLGQFTRCEPRDPAKPSFTSSQVLREFAAELPCPALGNLQYGHVPRKLTIPFGLRARIDAPRRTVTIPEAAVL